jgi:hypothetical protein
MRYLLISTAIAAAILATAGSALAQQPSPGTQQPAVASPASPATIVAPIGHRQPKISDLPPALADEERSGERSTANEPAGAGTRRSRPEDLIDERLRICRGC